MLNSLNLEGRFTADPELRTTTTGKNVASFTLAVARNVGEKQTDFIPWSKTADFICNYFCKGDMIIVEGSLQSRKWEDKNGNKRTAYECVADRVHFCGDRIGDKSGDKQELVYVGEDEDLPF